MVEIFKAHNEAWENTKCIMTDKDFDERAAFKEGFPQSKLLICLFHTLRSFKREISREKMGMSSGQRTYCLELAQNIAYSKNEAEYSNFYDTIQNCNVYPFIKYFNKNWHPIRDEWVPSLQGAFTLGNRTNNRLESMNSKVMQVVQRHSRLPDLFKSLDSLLISLRTERDERTARIHLKVPLNINFVHKDQEKYLKCLTPYAYGLITEKFNLIHKVKLANGQNSSQQEFKVETSSGLLTVSPEKCPCIFTTSVKLPCHHILFVRQIKGLSLFSEDLIPARWKKSYYLNNSRLNTSVAPDEPSFSVNVAPTKKVLSQHEKYNMVSKKFNQVVSLVSEAPSRLFPQRLQVLDKLITLWSESKEVSVEEISLKEGETPQEKHQTSNVESEMTSPESLETEVVKVSSTLPAASQSSFTIPEVLPVMPPKFKKRGRPKGSELTVVGLHSKRQKTPGAVPFGKKSEPTGIPKC